MRPVDEKIVKMTLENEAFKQKAVESANTLKSLTVAGKGVDLSAVSSAADTISRRFSIMGEVASAALFRLTNVAISSASKILSAFTIGPMIDGLQEYNSQLKSTRTIMVNTDRPLEDVTGALNELNEYADKTKYNFGDMTRSIGLFTTAGVGLEDSVTAIKGMSNLAAAMGSTPMQLQTAMYQSSQSLANGYIMLQDWNSMVNAGMGGKKVQEALEGTAKKMGVVRDESKSFRDSLKDGWLTTDIFLATMQDFANDPSMSKAATELTSFSDVMDTVKEAMGSGWAQIFRTLIGDLDEATVLWTAVGASISGVIDGIMSKLQTLAEGFVKLGGRDVIGNIVKNMLQPFSKIFEAVGKAWGKVFGILEAEDIYNFAKAIENLTSKFRLSQSATKLLESAFTLLFSGIKIGIGVIKQVSKFLIDLIPPNLDSALVSVGEAVINFVKGLSDGIPIVSTFFDAIKKIPPVMDVLKGLFDKTKSAMSALWDYMKPIFENIKDFVSNISFDSILKAVGALGTGLAALGIFKLFKKFKGIFDIFSGKKKMPKLSLLDTLKSALGDVGDKVSDTIGSVGDALKTFTTGINVLSLVGIASALLILATAMDKLKDLNGVQIAKSLIAIGAGLAILVGGLKAISKLDLAGFSSIKSVTTLIGMAAAIKIMTSAMEEVAGIDPERVGQGIGAMVALMLAMSTSMRIMNGTKVGVGSLQFLAFAVSVKMIASELEPIGKMDIAAIGKGLLGLGGVMAEMAVFMKVVSGSSFGPVKATGLLITVAAIKLMGNELESLSKLKWDEIGRGLAGLGGLMAELAIFVNLAGRSSFGVGQATAVVILAGALKLMGSAMEDIAGMKWEEIGKGLAGIGGLLLEIAIFSRLVESAGTMKAATSMILMATAVKMFVGPMKEMAALSWEEIAKGLVGMAGGLAALGAVSYVAQGSIAGSIGIVLMAGALNMIVGPIKELASMSWEELAKGLVGLGVAMGGLAIIGTLASGTILGAIGLSMLSLALGPLASALERLGQLSWEEIAKGLVAVLGGLAGIAAIGATLGTVAAPGLLALGAGLLMIGGSVFLAASGLMLFSAAIGSLALVTGATVAAAVSALGMFIRELAKIIPDIVGFAVDIIVALAEGLAEASGSLIDSALIILTNLMQGLSDNVYMLADSAITIITEITNAIADNVDPIVDSAMNLMLQFTQGIAEGLNTYSPLIYNSLVDIFAELSEMVIMLLTGVISAMVSFIPGASAQVTQMGVDLAGYVAEGFDGQRLSEEQIAELTGGLAGGSGDAYDAGKGLGQNTKDGANSVGLTDTGSNKGSEFTSGVNGKTGDASSAGTGLGNSAKSGAQSVGLTDTGSNKGNEFASGLKGTSGTASSSGAGVSTSAKTGAGSVGFGATGRSKGTEFSGGIRGTSSSASSAGKGVANSGKSGMESVSARPSGVNFGQGFINGISSMASSVWDAASSLASKALKAVRDTIGEASPAKKLITSGRNFGQGFINGIGHKLDGVATAGREMARTAMDAVNDGFNAIGEGLDGLEFNPTVRPVMDWSSVGGTTMGVNMNPYFADIKPKGQNDNNAQSNVSNNSNVYEIHTTIQTTQPIGEMSQTDIDRFSAKVEQSIRNQTNKRGVSRGTY